ncbi:FadR/GntR family transcriptional regulator [Sporomusa acidovorans]|uniref:HTH-type transcriptional repressor NanR n=1 Tax=Sporomusa acidovorans (strain ATCC 49682 / DSM 3132 / Mol) TaxID=1123286 RepID=A0ABZ3JBE5_SPOA4|nr:GntR family transcriptional regulator [Sporomusa acidovorans]OZC13252.1 HTH-type transcriptional regulator LutR [Sporomusa acidovorans DSM 3132]SDD99504.1 GntR family transcriptional regulator, transcriptional repressor for pyruvate dehydrogenase complex [Sporomusa acidovorans]
MAKLVKVSLVDQVCDKIKENITSKQWEAGFKIPSEQELANNFGVNRLTIRMALQKLNTLGIVETKAGEGTFVKKFSFRKYVSEVTELFMKPEMLNDVCEFRKCIEIECVRLAIERATSECILELEKAFDEYERVTNEVKEADNIDIDRLIEADLEFHYQICKASKNSLFVLAFIAARESIYQYLKSINVHRCQIIENEGRSIIEFMQNSTYYHKQIVETIKNADFQKCKKIYLEMIDLATPI